MLAADLRARIVGLCQDLSRKGYFAATGGNLAIRLDADRFAVTPSATDYFTMTPADVCILRLADLHKLEGNKNPSVETTLHSHMLSSRPDMMCSIHTHQPGASAAALLGKKLTVNVPALRQTLGREVGIVGYRPSGTGLLANLFKRALRPYSNAYLMRNHGVVCCGASVEAALQALDDLEALVRAELRRLIGLRRGTTPEQTAILGQVLTLLGTD